jgi:hypothetical protein
VLIRADDNEWRGTDGGCERCAPRHIRGTACVGFGLLSLGLLGGSDTITPLLTGGHRGWHSSVFDWAYYCEHLRETLWVNHTLPLFETRQGGWPIQGRGIEMRRFGVRASIYTRAGRAGGIDFYLRTVTVQGRGLGDVAPIDV